MLKRLPHITFSDRDQDEMELSEWAWNSHYWEEKFPGYYKCKWCNSGFTNRIPISERYLCKENPVIKNMLARLIS
jgi:hypothetical protein